METLKFVIIGLLAIALMYFIYEDSWIVGIVAAIFIIGSIIASYFVSKENKKKHS